MDQVALLGIIVGAGLGALAMLAVLRRQRQALQAPRESPFGASTEGEKLCPKCGMGNLWTQDRCITCGAKLPG